MKPNLLDIPREELTFEERYQFLRRLRFWANLFSHEAEGQAFLKTDGAKTIYDLVEGLQETRFIQITPDFADRMERVSMNLTDPVELWRAVMGLENHQVKLRDETLALFPEKKEKLEYFMCTNFTRSPKVKKSNRTIKNGPVMSPTRSLKKESTTCMRGE